MYQTVHIDDCQPSQLWIDQAKLSNVLSWIDPGELRYNPILVLPTEVLPVSAEECIEAPYVSIDGHTRGLCGDSELSVEVAEPDEYVEVYAQCVEWCLDAGIRKPTDLVGRVVSTETFRSRWVDRCHSLECHPGSGPE